MYSTTEENLYQKEYAYWHSKNRRRSQPADPEQAGYGRRRRSRRFTPPRGISRGAYSGKLFPNGEFTIGYVGFARKRVNEARYDRGEVYGYVGVSPSPDSCEINGKIFDIPHEERTFQKLALSSAQNCHKVKKRYGKNGITPFGRRRVRNGAERIQEVFSRHRTAFVTLTVPDYPPPIRKVVYARWGQLTRKYFQELKRLHEKSSHPFCYVSVTEVQSHRWKDSGNPGLHIHYCCPIYKLSSKRGDYLVTPDWIREVWGRLLQNLIDTIPLDGVEFRTPTPRVDIQRVKYSASAYLSKYMSKGSELVKEVIEYEGEDCVPGQWWSMSANLKEWISANTSQISAEAMDCLLSLYRHGQEDCFIYASQVCIECPIRGELTVSLSGKLSDEMIRFVTQTSDM